MPNKMLDILDRLIGINTATETDTLAAAEFAGEILAAAGAETRLIYNPKKTRASLIAAIGNPENPGLILSGHLDVVPPGENWRFDPWKLTADGGRLYGRGTADMKGAVAAALSSAPQMAASGKTFRFVLTHDEEAGGRGIKEVLNDPAAAGMLARSHGCIVMEATGNKLVIGQKSAVHGAIDIAGRAAHSSNPSLGVNALRHAVKIYEMFYELADGLLDETDAMFQVPHAVCEICMMNAGRAMNIIPDNARIDYLCRFLNATQKDRFFADLKSRLADYALGHPGLAAQNAIDRMLAGFNTAPDCDFVRRMLAVAPLATPPKVSYGTEAGPFAELGVPTAVLGPGDIAQAHAADEFIETSQLSDFSDILLKLI